MQFTATIAIDLYAARARRIVIRHNSDDQIVALIEIVSPGNKASRPAFETFIDKTTAALSRGYHRLLIDLFPPGPRDPNGLHGAIWSALADDSYESPKERLLTLAAYTASVAIQAYIEPVAVGDALRAMLLFLLPEHYVDVPLEETSMTADRSVPHCWREVLEAAR